MRHKWMIFIALALLSVTGLAAQEQPTEAPGLPLQVIDTDPLPGEELGLDSPISIYFDRPVDCASAQTAFNIEPAVAGTLTCDPASASLTFTPSDSFERAATYAVNLDGTLRAQDGGTLADPLSLDLNTIGYLAVAEIIPDSGTDSVDPQAVITVIFNRPVVPLVTSADMDSLPDPLTITPAVEGEGEWLNTSIYVFRPEPGLAGSTTYEVTVDGDLTAVDGAVMAEPFTSTFATVGLSINEVQPEVGAQGVALRQPLQITFNQPVDRETVEANFYLRPEGETGTSIAGTFRWNDESSGFSFTPDERLELDTLYEYGFASDTVVAQAGGNPLVGSTAYTFQTVPEPAVVSTDPQDGQSGVSPYNSVTIYFASPMDAETILDNITIEPEPWREPDGYYSDYDNSYYLSFPTEPSTDYTLTLGPGMEDIYGNTIDEATVINYSTAPYEPEILLQTPGMVGFYNANNPETRLFLTHRNVTSVDLQLYSVPLDQFKSLLASEDSYTAMQTYVPLSEALLRTWQIDTAGTPENRRRYELLNLGSPESGTVTCEGAPPSRIAVGDTVVVVTEPDSLNARLSPPDGEVVARLFRDYRLPIVGGPTCANSLVWWQVRLYDETVAWVAEGDLTEYYLEVSASAEATEVSIAGMDGRPLAPGIYYLQADAPQFDTLGYGAQGHFLVVGSANLTMKTSVDAVTVWATDVSTGLPIANAPVVLSRGAEVIGSAVTGADGLARFGTERRSDLYVPLMVTMESAGQFGVGYNGWSDGVEPWSFNQNYDPYPSRYRSYLYTDRPVYRPDQPVYFRGIVRSRDDIAYTVPPFDRIPVTIYNENSEIVYEESLPLTPFGSFSGQFDIAADAPLGYYRIAITVPGTEDQYYYGDGSIGFIVTEYRVPEFEVELAPAEPEVVQGDTIQVLVDSRYFFGGAVTNATVDYDVVAQPYSFSAPGAAYYSFEDFNYDGGPSEFYGYGGGEVASGTGTTDAQGRLLIEVPASLEDSTQSQEFTIEATVRDESGLAVSGRTTVVVHKGLVYVGVRPRDYVGLVNEPVTIDLLAVDWATEPPSGVAGQTIEVEVFERRWSSVQEQDEFGQTTYTSEVEEIPVTDGSVTTGDDGQAEFTFTPAVGGIYRIKATGRDADGNEVVASNTVWVSSSEYVSWRQQNSNRIDLITSGDEFEIGDTAEILITSPFQGSVEALVTVERGDVLLAERVTMNSNSFVYELPITENFAPNVYVSVMLVKGVDENNPVAAFRMGIAQLSVSTEQKEIRIDIEPDREQAGPRETVTYTVRTTDYSGAPVSAEVGVGLTDLATLSVGDPNSGPLMAYFYGQQGLAVRTSTPLTINTDLLTQTTLDTIKGGGGGFGEGGIFDIRQQFVDTAYWNPTLTTDASGEASFSVTLPDNLTTWRLDARAITLGDGGSMLVGQETFDLLSTKPLLVRAVTPRFFVVDDEVVLAAIVNNNTDAEQTVRVALDFAGVMMDGESEQVVTIPAGGRQRVDWPVTVEDVDSVDLTFFASSEDGAFTDATKPPLGQGDERLIPVYRYEVPETVGTSGLLREAGSRTEAVALPRRFEVSEGELHVNLETSLAATTIEGLDYLRNFPHQCVEQTVSRFLPNIITYRALESLDVADPALEANLVSAVNFALQRLYAAQHVDGGWGWFVQDASNPLTTAYALIGLVEAKNQGFTVSDEVIGGAQTFLRSTLIVPGLDQPTWRLNRQAFVLYALARSGDPDVARTTTLFESRDRLAYYARAFLAMALHTIDPNDTSRTDALVSDLISGAAVSATGAHWQESERDYWNWNTDTRTTAIVLDALLMLRPDSDLVPNAVRYLMSQRIGDAWETTQETAWAVMALTDWMLASGELRPDYTYSASLNGQQIAEATASPATVTDSNELVIEVSDMLAEQANQIVFERGEGPGVLYYTAHLRTFLPVAEVAALDRGIIIDRRYTLADGDAGESITEARVGDLIQVRLTVITPNDLHYVVIEDPIPAGAEAINPDLATSQQVNTAPELDPSDPLSFGWGWWWFSNIEFRDEKVVLYSTYLPAGTYEYRYSMRAGLPGTYNVIPSTGYEFYFPEVYGRTAGSQFTILPAE